MVYIADKTVEMVKIRVNAYDLTPLNRILRCIHFGIYHTSVVIDERSEYYYGFYQFGQTGIDAANVINELPKVMNGIFYESFEMGDSHSSYEECDAIVQQFRNADRWLSERYNIIWHNCNNFTFELCEALLGAGNARNFPQWVHRFEYAAKYIVSISLSHIIYFNNYTLAVIGRPPEKREELPIPAPPTDEPAQDIESAN
jgi:hypothetical protein